MMLVDTCDKTYTPAPSLPYQPSPGGVSLVARLPSHLLLYCLLSNNVPLSTPTCEDGGADHFALLTPPDSVEADLIFCSRKKAGQGVVGHVAVNHHAVHSTCRRTSEIRHQNCCRHLTFLHVQGTLTSQLICVLHHRVNI